MLRLRLGLGKYPAQFWLMVVGMLISTIGSSMVWPFLMIFMTTRLHLPLTQAAGLMSLNAAVALGAAFLAGPVIDRFGRKWMMVISLLGIGGVYFFYIQANTYAFTALLMALTGFFNPLYRVGADAMMADLIPAEQRADGYALMRMSNNLGIAIGPAIGGFLAAASYNYAFLGAGFGMSAYGVLIALFARETLPGRAGRGAAVDTLTQPAARSDTLRAAASAAPRKTGLSGYLHVFADRPFLYFVIAFTFNQVCAALIWVLLGVYAKTQYGLTENMYGFLPMTNAVLVVALQAWVTRRTKRHAALPVLALGSSLYAIAVTSVAFGRGFGGFWISMVIMTMGELILMPTATTYTANLAPADMRGRYMSIYGLTWNVAQGIGPLAGGFLSDTIAPTAPWLAGGLVGLLSATSFLVLARRSKARARAGTPRIAPG